MAQPVWITPAGPLEGPIPEGIFFRKSLLATTDIVITDLVANGTRVTVTFDQQRIAPYSVGQTVEIAEVTPTTYNGTYTVVSCTTTTLEYASTVTDTYVNGGGVVVDPNDSIRFELIAGTLPQGIQIAQSGLITGTPIASISVQGIPEQVNRDVTTQFAVRAYTVRNNEVSRLADRTFTLTVTGQNAPEFTTPAGQIAQYYDGTVVTDLQIGYIDPDPGDITVVKLRAGGLPPGLTISSTGLISGFIAPNAIVTQTAGFSRDGQGYDEYPFDFSTKSSNVNFEFVLELTDGKSSSLRTFSIFVWSRSDLTADTTFITADNTFITADGSPLAVPVILTPQGSIGTVRNDNFFAFQFTGVDIDDDPFKFIADGDLPPGLTLNADTGWLSGYIPDLGITELTYDTVLRVYKTYNPDVISDPYNYTLTITGPISNEIIWLTPSDPVAISKAEITGIASLGSIPNGSTSLFYVEAVNLGGLELQYRLVSGSASSLPQGLQLLPTGEIAGRVSFNTFALDSGTTTFDLTKENGSDPTTFDMTFVFTVNAYSLNGVVNVTKTFSITVVRVYDEPYDNLYIQAMPPQNDRDLINSLLQNSDIFKPNLIYRPQDPNFGVSSRVVYYHAYGLTSATLADYYASLYENHYWKNLILGEIKTAQACDADGRVIYEVVYSQIVDDLVNAQGESVSKAVALPYAIDAGDSTEIDVVYPNSLINMRDQVIDTVGQISKILPLWMTSKQADGSVLGFTPAWVLAYAKPDCADRIAYYIKTQFDQRLNVIDFKVDRYELDRLLSKNWDPVTDNWVPTPAQLTTFDIIGVDAFIVTESYVIGAVVNYNNLVYICIADTTPGILPTNSYYWEETQSSPYTVPWINDSIETVVWTNNTPAPVSWIPTVFGTEFDGGSMQFVDPVDMYSNTTAYDKYLVFPHRTILG
jgi:hypothetical protein